MRLIGLLLGLTLLAGCVVPAQTPQSQTRPAQSAAPAQTLPPATVARNFVSAVDAVEPVAEAFCRARTRNQNCDFQIVVDDRPNQAANAFQTLDANGRPILGFNLALIADARNIDEIAFVMGHEAAHHILGHIPQQQKSATSGALLAGILVAVGGGGEAAVQQAQRMGATVGARRFSKGFELEADALGAEITQRAGFNALRGAAFFDRLPDPGDQFLGSHPPNAARRETVQRVVSGLR
ncbi:Peptidase family M48 [Pseudorhodobacter antarcticus]|uniref:Peptidase family M48 n=1 Tax=Pseudorhodobacter antarcticus TaxID=1077947 RepID=A0A1H8F2M8_9RHOB|nr:M48 family metallopeptidase [Pseudorhodobacter antarcticus]SEN26151.1 Peptidase family M48 [Pseudorhodobacter antarcticus]